MYPTAPPSNPFFPRKPDRLSRTHPPLCYCLSQTLSPWKENLNSSPHTLGPVPASPTRPTSVPSLGPPVPKALASLHLWAFQQPLPLPGDGGCCQPRLLCSQLPAHLLREVALTSWLVSTMSLWLTSFRACALVNLLLPDPPPGPEALQAQVWTGHVQVLGRDGQEGRRE